MAKFTVPAVLAPCVFRSSSKGSKRYPPGSEMFLPDQHMTENPGVKVPIKLVPRDKEALDMLIEMYGQDAVMKAHPEPTFGPAAEVEPVVGDDGLTMKQFGKGGSSQKRKASRASDKE